MKFTYRYNWQLGCWMAMHHFAITVRKKQNAPEGASASLGQLPDLGRDFPPLSDACDATLDGNAQKARRVVSGEHTIVSVPLQVQRCRVRAI